MSTRLEKVLWDVHRRVSDIAEKQQVAISNANRALVEKMLDEPDFKAAMPVIKMLYGMNPKDQIGSIMHSVRPDGALHKRLVKAGWKSRDVVEQGYNWGRTNRGTLLETALATTSKKIWTDLHSPLKLFLTDLEKASTLADVNRIVDKFLKELE